MSNKSNKTMKLIFADDAPEESTNGLRITFGEEFSRLFKKTEQPFTVERRFGEAILRNYNEFKELTDESPKEELTLSGLKKLQREVLDDKAREYGIEKPEDLTNKEAVAKAILKKIAENAPDNSDDADSSSEASAEPLDPNKGEITVPDEKSETENSEEKSDESEKEQG